MKVKPFVPENALGYGHHSSSGIIAMAEEGPASAVKAMATISKHASGTLTVDLYLRRAIAALQNADVKR